MIDANVLIKQIRLRDLLNDANLGIRNAGTEEQMESDADFNDKYEVHTLIEVIKEIRDEQVR